MVGPAERIGDPLLSAMPHEHHARIVDRGAALRALVKLLRRRQTLRKHASLPVRPLHRPRDNMFQAAEDGEPFTSLLRRSEALVHVDRNFTPAAALTRHARDRIPCKIRCSFVTQNFPQY